MYVDPHLPRHIFGWYSSRLGLDMPIVSYGDRGHPLLIYPTAQADFLENERFLLDQVDRAPHLRRPGAGLLHRQHQPLRLDEPQRVRPRGGAAPGALLRATSRRRWCPTSAACSSNPRARVGVTGASFGAFHAANQFFRRPDLFDTLIAMSGFYDLEPDYTDGLRDDDVYFNNPVSYLANMERTDTLDLLRHEHARSTSSPARARTRRRTLLAAALGAALDEGHPAQPRHVGPRRGPRLALVAQDAAPLHRRAPRLVTPRPQGTS